MFFFIYPNTKNLTIYVHIFCLDCTFFIVHMKHQKKEEILAECFILVLLFNVIILLKYFFNKISQLSCTEMQIN